MRKTGLRAIKHAPSTAMSKALMKNIVTKYELAMLELDFQQYLGTDKALDARGVIDRVSAVQAVQGNRAANKQLLDAVGIALKPTRNESYYGEALAYHLALIHARLGEADAVEAHMRRSNTMPAGGGDTIFAEHVLESVILREWQDRARVRGAPSILTNSMPRSASATLATLLSQQFDVPVLRVSVGDFPRYIIVPSWLDMFLGGGAVNHDHFGATSFNLQTLSKTGVRDLFVLIRDPRAAAASAVSFRRSAGGAETGLSFEEEVVAALQNSFLPWLNGWITYAADAGGDVRVHWLFWKDLCERPGYVVNQICKVAGIANFELRPSDVRENFVTGDDRSWRNNISPAVQRIAWEALGSGIADLIDLEP
jgi:hypothetical protein